LIHVIESHSSAAAKFIHALWCAIGGDKGVITLSFIKSLYESKGATYFSSNVELGVTGPLAPICNLLFLFLLLFLPYLQLEGLSKIHLLGQLSTEEEKLIQTALPELKKNIEKGVNFLSA
jgi:malate dehydrogenase